MGAGPCGLSAAIALSKISTTEDPIHVTLLEVRPELKTIGGTLNMTPLAMRYLDHLGAGEVLRRDAIDLNDGLDCVSLCTGRRIGNIWGGIGSIRTIRHNLVASLLHTITENHVGKIDMRWGQKVVGISESGDHVVLTFEDGTTLQGDILLGCDGIHSGVRRSFVEPEREKSFTGRVIAMGFESTGDVQPMLLFNAEPAVRDTTVITSPHGMLLVSKYEPTRRKTYFAHTMYKEEPKGNARDGWEALGVDKDAVRSEVLHCFEDGRVKGVQEAVAKCQDWHLWPIYILPGEGRWYRNKVLLLGDAAHAMPPQGESTGLAIEDGVLIARVLERRKSRTVEQLFADFVSVRKPVVDKYYSDSVWAMENGFQRASWWKSIIIEWGIWFYLIVKRWRQDDHFSQDKSGCGISCSYLDVIPNGPPSYHLLAPSPTTQPAIRDNHEVQATPLTSIHLLPCQPPAVRSTSSSSNPPEGLDLGDCGSGYKARSHWTSILNDVEELKDNTFVPGGSILDAVTVGQSQTELPPSVLLLQGCRHASEEELLAALPSRANADRLVAYYFVATEFSLCILHKDEFKKQYNKFWESPSSIPVSWLALLFSVFCLSLQFQNPSIRLPLAPESTNVTETRLLAVIQQYRKKTVQSLVLARYGKGGPFVVEAMLHYLMSETSLRRDSDMEIWIVLGILVQIAIRMGYHRDPCNFASLSTFQGEMRRRMWSTLYQADMSVSTQLGLPTIIKGAISDTRQPRNLCDSDFNASSEALPTSRSDREVTPTLLLASKHRIMSIFSTISDLITDVQPSSYSRALEIDTRLNDAFASIPEPCKHRSLSLSITDPPTLIFQRIYIQLLHHRAQIVLHQRYFAMARDSSQYDQSKTIAVQGALSILHYQELIDEESQPGGRFGSLLMQSPFMSHEFLLAASVVCFYIHYFMGRIEMTQLQEIEDVSRRAEAIWSRTTMVSTESLKAAQALRMVIHKIDGYKRTEQDVTADTSTQLLVTGDSSDSLPHHGFPLSYFDMMIPNDYLCPILDNDQDFFSF
ncbi:putative Fungal-specific transcription factor domain-containing protein [Seiridium cardinale]|uniref:Fungal-specific transcription factor domain-containing protein n=1 Tax=Seiridium cardinale TaxID=138064 RepID=A0ABR2Y2Q9_9PEZI